MIEKSASIVKSAGISASPMSIGCSGAATRAAAVGFSGGHVARALGRRLLIEEVPEHRQGPGVRVGHRREGDDAVTQRRRGGQGRTFDLVLGRGHRPDRAVAEQVGGRVVERRDRARRAVEDPFGAVPAVATEPPGHHDPLAVVAPVRIPADVGGRDAVRGEPVIDGLAEDDHLTVGGAAAGPGAAGFVGDPDPLVHDRRGETHDALDADPDRVGQFLGRFAGAYPHLDLARADLRLGGRRRHGRGRGQLGPVRGLAHRRDDGGTAGQGELLAAVGGLEDENAVFSGADEAQLTHATNDRSAPRSRPGVHAERLRCATPRDRRSA